MAVDMTKLTDGNGLLYGLKGLKAQIVTLLGNKVDKVSGKGLSTNDYTTDEKNKLAGIATGANKYTLPTASSSVLGGIKTGANITNTSGVLSLTKDNVTGALGYIPPTKDTTYGAFKGATASAAGAAGLVPAPGTADAETYLKGNGTWGTPVNTTYNPATTSTAGLMSAADKTKLDGIASGANKYSLPTASSSTLGGVKTTSTVTSTTGLTAAPIIGGVVYYKDTNTTYNAASQSANGLMSAADKKKLDAFGAAGTYATQTYVGQQIAAAGHITKTIVTALPAVADAKDNVIYMIKKASGSSGNLYDEYMLIDGALEKVGDTETKISTLSNADVEEILGQI